MAGIFSDICTLKQVGTKRQKLYNKLGIYTINDLIWHIPRGYIDFGLFQPVSSFELGEVFSVKAMALGKKVMRLRNNLAIYSILAADGHHNFTLKIFNSIYAYNSIVIGQEYVFLGRVSKLGKVPELNLIDWIKYSNELTMKPVYRLTSGLSSKMIAQNVREALTYTQTIPDFMPQNIRKTLHLSTLEYALNNIHFPKNQEALDIARKRLSTDELVIFNSSMAMQNSNYKLTSGYKISPVELNTLISSAGFEPTKSQLKAIGEITNHLTQGSVMTRLVQGDVGCGKTFVAAAAIFMVCKNGYQAAFMAPTELLANQHYQYLTHLFSRLGVRVALICGSLKPKERRTLELELKSGEIDCLVGTHAIISGSVQFAKLALVVTDEQHKFGVSQREKLSAKSENPHVLIMSATPIPRTLALMLYESLEVSIIDELPLNRLPIKTYFVTSSYRARVFEFIKKALTRNQQCYIVCPLVQNPEDIPHDSRECDCRADGLKDKFVLTSSPAAPGEPRSSKTHTQPASLDDSALDLKPVIQYSEKLKNGPFHDFSVEFVHGKQSPSQKEQIMQDFKQGKIQVLIATTVIEVGIDVPNATIILIENSERFGLAQLHQLRGRVGRSAQQSYCILLSDSSDERVKKRLKFVASHTNGFEIAEYDLKMRGPGEFLGTKQHGIFDFKLAKYINEADWLVTTKQITKKILKKDPTLSLEENAYLKKMVENSSMAG